MCHATKKLKVHHGQSETRNVFSAVPKELRNMNRNPQSLAMNKIPLV